MNSIDNTRHETTRYVKSAALQCGFDAVGICHADVLEPERARFLKWIESGCHAGMRWITRDWIDKSSDPALFLPDARSVVCVAVSYGGTPAGRSPAGSGRVARYAQGRDYHELLLEGLEALTLQLADLGGHFRPFVDAAPTMDKALAVRAGIGWQGRNTMVLSSELGSFTFLGGLVSDLDLEPDQPQNDGCGACRLCVRACPTGALKGDYTIDAGLCISYLTIEHRGSIPRSMRSSIGDWVFGCDYCQDVCPPTTRLQDASFPSRKVERIEFNRAILRRKPAHEAKRTQ